MKKNLLYIFFCLFTLLSPAYATTESLSNDSTFSLLTCSPGKEIYSLFGHTAIRYIDKSHNTDIVFNYGLFDFNKPFFIWRFIKGETDYELGIESFDDFKGEYMYYNRAVTEQILNLTAKEKETLLNLLSQNYLPQNRVYRYNFFYDNCSTRPRDKIKQSIDGTIIYTSQDKKNQSYRDLINEFTEGHLWSRFGINLLIGSKADKPISYQAKMFIPYYLMHDFSSAKIKSTDNSIRNLTDSAIEIIPSDKNAESNKSNFLPNPLPLFSILLALILIVTIVYYKKTLWGIDLILFAAAGIAGCIIFFVTCFSTHPTVSPNYLLILFQPFHLFLLPFFIRKEIKQQKSYYHYANFVVLTLFILLFKVFPQNFDVAVVPLALCLWIRSLRYIIFITYIKK
jgi:hypothetical protein